MHGAGLVNLAKSIPKLEALMKNNQEPVVGLRAIHALGEIGGRAIPALTNALADVNQTNRIDIIFATFAVERNSAPYYRDSHRAACLPALTRALNDPDAQVRRQAAITLYHLTDPDILAPLRGSTFLYPGPAALTNAPP